MPNGQSHGTNTSTRTQLAYVPICFVTFVMVAACVTNLLRERPTERPPVPGPGSRYEPLLADLPATGRIGLVTDRDFQRGRRGAGDRYSLQALLVPRFVPSRPDTKFAVIACSSDEIATERMQQYGFRWHRRHGEGFGVGVRIEDR